MIKFEQAIEDLELALENFPISYEHCKSQKAHDIVFQAEHLRSAIDTWREGGFHE